MQLFMQTRADIQVQTHFQNGLPVTGTVHRTVAAGPQRVSDKNVEHTREVFVLQHTTVEKGLQHVRYKFRF